MLTTEQLQGKLDMWKNESPVYTFLHWSNSLFMVFQQTLLEIWSGDTLILLSEWALFLYLEEVLLIPP